MNKLKVGQRQLIFHLILPVYCNLFYFDIYNSQLTLVHMVSATSFSLAR